MGFVNLPDIQNGDEANAQLFNSRFGAIANVLNGNVDADNLAANAVTTAKIAARAASRDKLATVTRTAPFPIHAKSVTGVGAIYPDTSTNGVRFVIPVPDDYISGDLSIRLWFRGPTSGDIKLQRDTYRFRKGSAIVHVHAALGNVLTMAAGSTEFLFTIASGNFAIGDSIRVDLYRYGGDVLDTAAGDVDLDHSIVEYTGLA